MISWSFIRRCFGFLWDGVLVFKYKIFWSSIRRPLGLLWEDLLISWPVGLLSEDMLVFHVKCFFNKGLIVFYFYIFRPSCSDFLLYGRTEMFQRWDQIFCSSLKRPESQPLIETESSDFLCDVHRFHSYIKNRTLCSTLENTIFGFLMKISYL